MQFYFIDQVCQSTGSGFHESCSRNTVQRTRLQVAARIALAVAGPALPIASRRPRLAVEFNQIHSTRKENRSRRFRQCSRRTGS